MRPGYWHYWIGLALPPAVVIALICLIRTRTWTTDDPLDLPPAYDEAA